MLIKKIVSLTVTICLLLSFVCGQSISAITTPLPTQQYTQLSSDIILPNTYGKITDSYFAGTDRLVINIQDLHCDSNVQKNISSIIGFFDKKYTVKNVYLEGAYGNVDTSWIENSSKQLNYKSTKELLDAMLSTGRLTGAEYYSALTNKNNLIKGLENKEPYLDNIKRFATIIQFQPEIEKILEAISNSTSKIKNDYYTKRQHKIEQLSQKYKKGKISQQKYYSLLEKYIDDLGISLEDYENTSLYIISLALQNKLNYSDVSRELQNCIFTLKQNITYNQYNQLLKDTENFSDIYKLIQYFKIFNLNVEKKYPNLNKYFRYIELKNKINPIDLVKEEQGLINEINIKFSTTVSQREVIFLINFERYLKDYVTTKITSDDYVYYKKNIEQYKNLWNKYVDNRVLSLLEQYLVEIDKFYEINNNRNLYFIQNLLTDTNINKLENIGNAQNNVLDNLNKIKEIDVVVAGGFHTKTINKILKEKNVSYIVITPTVKNTVKTSQNTYYKIAKEQGQIEYQTLANLIATLSPSAQNKIFYLLQNPDAELEDNNDQDLQKISQLVKELQLAQVLESDDVGDIVTETINIMRRIVDAKHKKKVTKKFFDKLKVEQLPYLLANKQELEKYIDLVEDTQLKSAIGLTIENINRINLIVNKKQRKNHIVDAIIAIILSCTLGFASVSVITNYKIAQETKILQELEEEKLELPQIVYEGILKLYPKYVDDASVIIDVNYIKDNITVPITDYDVTCLKCIVAMAHIQDCIEETNDTVADLVKKAKQKENSQKEPKSPIEYFLLHDQAVKQKILYNLGMNISISGAHFIEKFYLSLNVADKYDVDETKEEDDDSIKLTIDELNQLLDLIYSIKTNFNYSEYLQMLEYDFDYDIFKILQKYYDYENYDREKTTSTYELALIFSKHPKHENLSDFVNDTNIKYIDSLFKELAQQNLSMLDLNDYGAGLKIYLNEDFRNVLADRSLSELEKYKIAIKSAVALQNNIGNLINNITDEQISSLVYILIDYNDSIKQEAKKHTVIDDQTAIFALDALEDQDSFVSNFKNIGSLLNVQFTEGKNLILNNNDLNPEEQKQEFLDNIINYSKNKKQYGFGNALFVVELHGSQDASWITTTTNNDVNISVDEYVDALNKAKENGADLSEITLLFISCESYELSRSIVNELQNTGVNVVAGAGYATRTVIGIDKKTNNVINAVSDYLKQQNNKTSLTMYDFAQMISEDTIFTVLSGSSEVEQLNSNLEQSLSSTLGRDFTKPSDQLVSYYDELQTDTTVSKLYKIGKILKFKHPEQFRYTKLGIAIGAIIELKEINNIVLGQESKQDFLERHTSYTDDTKSQMEDSLEQIIQYVQLSIDKALNNIPSILKPTFITKIIVSIAKNISNIKIHYIVNKTIQKNNDKLLLQLDIETYNFVNEIYEALKDDNFIENNKYRKLVEKIKNTSYEDVNRIQVELVKKQRTNGTYYSNILKLSSLINSTPSNKLQSFVASANPYLIKEMDNPCFEAQSAAVSKDPSLIKFINNPDRKIQEIAVGKDISAIKYIENPTVQAQKIVVKFLDLKDAQKLVKYITDDSCLKILNDRFIAQLYKYNDDNIGQWHKFLLDNKNNYSPKFINNILLSLLVDNNHFVKYDNNFLMLPFNNKIVKNILNNINENDDFIQLYIDEAKKEYITILNKKKLIQINDEEQLITLNKTTEKNNKFIISILMLFANKDSYIKVFENDLENIKFDIHLDKSNNLKYLAILQNYSVCSIEGFNNNRIPADYLFEIYKNYLQSGFVTKGNILGSQSYNDCVDILNWSKMLFDKLSSKKISINDITSDVEMLDLFGFEPSIINDKISISVYEPWYRILDLSQLKIDENKLFENVVEIREYANVSNLHGLIFENIKYVDYLYSSSTDDTNKIMPKLYSQQKLQKIDTVEILTRIAKLFHLKSPEKFRYTSLGVAIGAILELQFINRIYFEKNERQKEKLKQEFLQQHSTYDNNKIKLTIALEILLDSMKKTNNLFPQILRRSFIARIAVSITNFKSHTRWNNKVIKKKYQQLSLQIDNNTSLNYNLDTLASNIHSSLTDSSAQINEKDQNTIDQLALKDKEILQKKLIDKYSTMLGSEYMNKVLHIAGVNTTEDVQSLMIKKEAETLKYIVEIGITPSINIKKIFIEKYGYKLRYFNETNLDIEEELMLPCVKEYQTNIVYIENPTYETQMYVAEHINPGFEFFDEEEEKEFKKIVNKLLNNLDAVIALVGKHLRAIDYISNRYIVENPTLVDAVNEQAIKHLRKLNKENANRWCDFIEANKDVYDQRTINFILCMLLNYIPAEYKQNRLNIKEINKDVILPLDVESINLSKKSTNARNFQKNYKKYIKDFLLKQLEEKGCVEEDGEYKWLRFKSIEESATQEEYNFVVACFVLFSESNWCTAKVGGDYLHEYIYRGDLCLYVDKNYEPLIAIRYDKNKEIKGNKENIKCIVEIESNENNRHLPADYLHVIYDRFISKSGYKYELCYKAEADEMEQFIAWIEDLKHKLESNKYIKYVSDQLLQAEEDPIKKQTIMLDFLGFEPEIVNGGISINNYYPWYRMFNVIKNESELFENVVEIRNEANIVNLHGIVFKNLRKIGNLVKEQQDEKKLSEMIPKIYSVNRLATLKLIVESFTKIFFFEKETPLLSTTITNVKNEIRQKNYNFKNTLVLVYGHDVEQIQDLKDCGYRVAELTIEDGEVNRDGINIGTYNGQNVRLKFNDDCTKLTICVKNINIINKFNIDKSFYDLIEESLSSRNNEFIKRDINQIVFVNKDSNAVSSTLKEIKISATKSFMEPTKEVVYDLTKQKLVAKNLNSMFINIANSTQATTFIMTKSQYEKYNKKISKNSKKEYKFIIKEDKNISEISNDGAIVQAVGITDVEEAIQLLEHLKKIHTNIDTTVYVVFSSKIQKQLLERNINVFEDYYVTPVVYAKDINNILGKSVVTNLDEDNIDKMLKADSVTSMIIDKKTENVVNKKKEKLQQPRTQKQKYNKGYRAGSVSKFDYVILDDDITIFKDIICNSITTARRKVKKLDINSLPISDDAKDYLQYLKTEERYVEIIGFIRAITENTVKQKLFNKLSLYDDGKYEELFNTKVNEKYQKAIIILLTQLLFANQSLDDILQLEFEQNDKAEEYLKYILIQLNGIVEKILEENEYQIKLLGKQDIVQAISDFININMFLEDRIESTQIDIQVDMSFDAIRSMLASA